ncbi:MAG: cobalamin biosynthesis protein [Desulfurococcales archaeon]|nr:cobalamin biosynthesis protein [Desulfurococcales archaeon]
MIPTIITGGKVLLTSFTVALIWDLIYPKHSGLLLKIHPVHTCFLMALKLHKPYSSKTYGFLVWSSCMLTHILPWVSIYAITSLFDNFISLVIKVIITSFILKVSFSIRLLFEECYNVYSCLVKGDINCGRRYAQGLVRRDLSTLGKEHICSATIESLAESFVDGFLAPVFYFLLLGPLGALAQRLINTLDSALGYKSEEFKDEGFFSARVDDVINFIPARLSVLLFLTSSLILRYDVKGLVRSWIKYSNKTESPNAGHSMSAMAGCLNIWLEKPGAYKLNIEGKNPGEYDILNALKIAVFSALITLSITLLILVFTI